MLLKAAARADDTSANPAIGPGRSEESASSDRIKFIILDHYDAMLFDMDGVITRSAKGHGELWKVVFDDFLKEFSARHNLPFRQFDAGVDYHDFVDGKPRYDGVGSFLASRGIMIPFGEPTDDEGTETCCGIGNRKNKLFLEHMEKVGVSVFDTSVAFVRDVRSFGKKIAVVSASKNAEYVLRRAEIFDLFDVIVSGREAAALSLAGKPAPDTYLKAMELLEAKPERSVVFEDSVTGVQAAKTAGVGMIVGVDRAEDCAALLWHGANVVVNDLCELAWS
jgi:HAD superfamily hydrolase (TIGR01509 family)